MRKRILFFEDGTTAIVQGNIQSARPVAEELEVTDEMISDAEFRKLSSNPTKNSRALLAVAAKAQLRKANLKKENKQDTIVQSRERKLTNTEEAAA